MIQRYDNAHGCTNNIVSLKDHTSSCLIIVLQGFITDGWVGNWARVGYVNHGSYMSNARFQLCAISSRFILYTVKTDGACHSKIMNRALDSQLENRE